MRRKPRQTRSQERVKRILDEAEGLFATEGYVATTTSAIAKRAQVPIGSLYQFFPDKSAILWALAERYMTVFDERFQALHQDEMLSLSLSEYVDRVIDITEQFFDDCPGYHAIFMQVQGTIPELAAIEEAADNDLIQDWATILASTFPGLELEDYKAIAYVMVKAIGTLLWLSLSQENQFRRRLVTETKRLILSYLQSYFPSTPMPAHKPAEMV
ncbi:MAG: TetR/AcrR family transcriptional regulator [Cyanobacteria bacterium P01_F01_bin.33]